MSDPRQDPQDAPSGSNPAYGETPYGRPDFGGSDQGQEYGQPGYGQPGYGPPGYGTPGYGTPAPYGPHGGQPYGPGWYGPAPTNTMAILALVFAFVFAPVAIVLGVMARKEIARTGEQGHGLATAGMWLGIAFTALFVLLFILPFVFFLIVGAAAATTPAGY